LACSWLSAVVDDFNPHNQWGTSRTIHLESLNAEVEISLYNKRLTILNYSFLTNEGILDLADLIENLCSKYDLGKAWGKIRRKDLELYTSQGFTAEAYIDNFFIDEDAVICAKYFGDQRKLSLTSQHNQEILDRLDLIQITGHTPELPAGYSYRIAEAQDVEVLSSLLSQVFKTYPYPIDQTYLLSTLEHTVYGLVYNPEGALVAAASAETNGEFKNAEMTDFATSPDERGKGLAPFILYNLEKVLQEHEYRTAYTIARSSSFSMNKVFKSAGYHYTGTLTNNCNISGGFEDMNVWCKSH
jgi:putative beta-lysine N-acetyltransferase